MEKAEFACEECDDATSTLNVHHKIYHKGRDPWDYEDRELYCLCESCHEAWHTHKERLNVLLTYIDIEDLRELVAFGATRSLLKGDLTFVTLVSAANVTGFALASRMKEEDVFQLMDEQGVITADTLKAFQTGQA
jgi:hypothetical protein